MRAVLDDMVGHSKTVTSFGGLAALLALAAALFFRWFAKAQFVARLTAGSAGRRRQTR